MGFVVILPFAALASWGIARIYRWLRRGDFGPEWWKAFRVLAVAGAALGIWLAFYARYQVGNTSLRGFPIPTLIRSREKPGDAWVEGKLPGAVLAGAAITNLLSGIAFCLLPVAAAAFFKEHKAAHGSVPCPGPSRQP